MSKDDPEPDELVTIWSRSIAFLTLFVLTVRLCFVDPDEVSLATTGQCDGRQRVMPPLRFFASSFLLAAALYRAVLFPDPISTFELPEITKRLEPVIGLIPLSIPLLAAIFLGLGSFLPWAALRVTRSSVSWKSVAYVYCYLYGSIVTVLLLILLAIDIVIFLRPVAWIRTVADDLQIALIVGFSGYSLYWITRVLAHVSALRKRTVAICVVISGVLFSIGSGPIEPIRNFGVGSKSMRPTLVRGDVVAINTWIYRSREPRPGEIVAYYFDGNSASAIFVHRVVGVSGDRISFQSGVLTVNDKVITREMSNSDMSNHSQVIRDSEDEARELEFIQRHEDLGGKSYDVVSPTDATKGPDGEVTNVVVPRGYVYVMGDDRYFANDSRYQGSIPLTWIYGRVYIRAFPTPEIL